MPTRTSGRVIISKNPKEHMELLQSILYKHYSMGGTSPLLQMDGVDLNMINSRIAPTIELHNAAEAAKRQMEENYRQRDEQMKPITNALKKCVALLKATYAGNPKKLGEWGLNVDDSPQAKEPKKP